jgi:cytochrome P450
LPWLDAVVKETLRLYPPAWILSRSALVDLDVAGHHVPAGGFVFVPIHALHRHPTYWDDPEGFDPQRWLDGRGEAARKAGMYLPFGAGQRRCVGEHLANLEAPDRAGHDPAARVPGAAGRSGARVPEASVTLRPKGGLWMSTTPRVVPAEAK